MTSNRWWDFGDDPDHDPEPGIFVGISAELTNKINALFRRLKRFGYTTCNITMSDLIDTSGRDLFRKLCSSEHSLHHLLLPERKYSNLRNRGHRYENSEYCTNLHKSFIIQSLYLYIWSFSPFFCFFFFFFTFVSCLLTATLHLVDVRLTCLINITYLFTYLLFTVAAQGNVRMLRPTLNTD